MKRFFAVVTCDVVLLVLPTQWMGPWVEFWLSLTLAIATGALWLAIKLSRDH